MIKEDLFLTANDRMLRYHFISWLVICRLDNNSFIRDEFANHNSRFVKTNPEMNQQI